MFKSWFLILVVFSNMVWARYFEKDSISKFVHSAFWANKAFAPQSFGSMPKLGLNDVSISGTLDFISYYRNISTGYPDLSGPKKTIEFTPYPSGGNFGGNFYRQPLLNVVFSANTSANSSFAIEYAMSHFYTGLKADSSKKLSVQNMLQLHGFVHGKYANILLTAGGGALNYSLSPLTIYNKDFREPMFEKLPWDWYSKSFEKYNDQYNASSTSTPSYISNSATQGFIIDVTELPLKLGASLFYGRSNFTLSPDRVASKFPSQIIAGKMYKGTDTTGKLSFNYYNQFGFVDNVSSKKDVKQIVTTEFKYFTSKIRLNAELGVGRVLNPSSDLKTGEALSLNFTVLNKKLKLPIQLQLYSLDKRVAALEASYLNANPTVSQGGYASEKKYNNAYYPSYLQEVNMLVNNRLGGFLKVDKILKKFRFELGNALSIEKENLSYDVSFQQMVNAFSRSRFKPWIQNSGPYQMLNYRYRRLFQTITITDSSNYKKVFNAADVSIKYNSKIIGKGLIFVNYTYVGSVSKTINLLPSLNSKSFVYSIYNETSAYLNIHPKLTIISFYSYQTTKANTNTLLNSETLKPVYQQGIGYGFGFDYDFANNAGLFLRHRWMRQNDQNFVLDKFKGQESIVELKIFF